MNDRTVSHGVTFGGRGVAKRAAAEIDPLELDVGQRISRRTLLPAAADARLALDELLAFADLRAQVLDLRLPRRPPAAQRRENKIHAHEQRRRRDGQHDQELLAILNFHCRLRC